MYCPSTLEYLVGGGGVEQQVTAELVTPKLVTPGLVTAESLTWEARG